MSKGLGQSVHMVSFRWSRPNRCLIYGERCICGRQAEDCEGARIWMDGDVERRQRQGAEIPKGAFVLEPRATGGEP